MTAKEKKDYLSQLKKIDRRIEIDLRKAEKLRAVLDYSPASGGTGGSGCSANKIPDTLAKVMEFERKAHELKDRYIELYIEIEKAIAAVADPVQREVLERRYMLYQKWEDIAEQMHFTERRIYQIHGRALQKISLNFSI
jgi:DNA-directed RNA polymerase specialized sigma24 family protein